MKIAWIVPGGVDRSGRERVIPVLLWLIEALADRHELHVFALRQYADACTYPLLGAMIHNLGQRSGSTGFQLMHWLVSLASGLRTAGPFDVIHGFWANDSGFLAALLGKMLNIPSIITLAGGELVALPEISYGSQLNFRSRLRVNLTCRLAGQVTAASRYMCMLSQQCGIEALEIPLGVQPPLFVGPPSPPPGPPWRLLHVASLNRVKDQSTLLRAMKHVVAAEPQTQLDIISRPQS